LAGHGVSGFPYAVMVDGPREHIAKICCNFWNLCHISNIQTCQYSAPSPKIGNIRYPGSPALHDAIRCPTPSPRGNAHRAARRYTPEGVDMARVKIYSTGTCPICEKTKTLLNKWGIPYEEVRVDMDRDALREMMEVTNRARSVPQITIDGRWIGGFNELTELHMDGELDSLGEQ
jgi:glutaredoxin 3